MTMLEKPIDPVSYGSSCAGCQIIIAEPWYHKLRPAHYLE